MTEINAKQRLQASLNLDFPKMSPGFGLRLYGFIGPMQFAAITEGAKGEEKEYFIEKVKELQNVIMHMPKSYEQDGKGDKAVAYLHYFKGGNDWYITERDMEDTQHQAFGLASLHGNDPELGYISLFELSKYNVELDLHFKPTTIGELKRKHA